MMEWIMSIAALCDRGIAIAKTLQKWSADALTQREKELLVAAHQDGLFYASQSDLYGKFVFTSHKQFFDQDPAITAHYLDAFIQLCERGLVIHQTESVFRLTGQGFDIARKLAKSVS